MKDSAKIWYSIRRGTLRIVLAAFAACAAATVPANVVRNDLVTATSDAELETSDKGMGLGINVVGGGDAVITLETRPGWTFRDGSTTYTMKKLAGVDARSPEIVNEGSTVESGGEIPAGETEKEKPEEEKPEEKEPEEGGVEHVPPEVSISVKSVPTAAAYALPANSATVAFELSASVKSDAEHWETDKNGNKTNGPETFSPSEYVWKAVASNTVTAVCVEWGASLSDKSATGALQLGKGTWKVAFSVYAKATCPICNATVESAEDDEVRTVTVYEVSINRPDYLGLDQTDAGRKGHTVKDATLVTDPEYVGLDDNAVTWTACGELCEFKDENGVAKSKGEKANYRNKGPDNASKSLNAEPLTAKVSIPGAEDVYCTTNFTVVKVDVSIGGTGEGGDETAPQNVIYSRELTKFAITNMTPVKVTCEPKSLPGMELVWLTLPDNVELFELGEDGTAKSAKPYYRYNEIGGKSFGLLGRPVPTETADGWAPEFKGGYVVVDHYSSGAKDKGAFKVVPPPPLEITDVQFLSPNTKKNGAWPYDPIWDDDDWKVTVDGRLAKDCAEDADDATVKYTLSRDAEKVDIEFRDGKWSWSDTVGSIKDAARASGVQEEMWAMPNNLKPAIYYAKVVAIEAETDEKRTAMSNGGELRRECYYYSRPEEVSDPLPSSGHVEVTYVTKADENFAQGKKVVANIALFAAAARFGGKKIVGMIETFVVKNFGIDAKIGSVVEVAVNVVAAIKGWFGIEEWEKQNTKVVWYYWTVHRYDWIGGKYVKHDKDNPNFGDPTDERAMDAINAAAGIPRKIQSFSPDIEMIVRRYYVAVPCENGQYKYLDLDSPTKSDYISTEKGGEGYEGNEDMSKFRWEPTPYEGGYGLKCPEFSE